LGTIQPSLLGAIEPNEKQEKGTRNPLVQVSSTEEHWRVVFTIAKAWKREADAMSSLGTACEFNNLGVRNAMIAAPF
jgi:hypothetical protein